MDILRIATAGSVDDGKSTLIGRLLFETQSITKDKIEALEAASARKGLDFVDLSLLTDGLIAEREQGITIDVAHIYFNTPNRKYIIADTPGHFEYTRNMVTGASNASVSIILVDARNGVSEQTRRHFYIATLLEIKHIIVAVNKMDLVSYSQHQFDRIVSEFNLLAEKVKKNDQQIEFIPLSSLYGENIVQHSQKMDWYQGQSLLNHLENISNNESQQNNKPFRFPVQHVIRPKSDAYHDFRGYAGRIASGSVSVGDRIKVLPSGQESTISGIQKFDTQLQQAGAKESVVISLADDVDLSRGNLIVKTEAPPLAQKQIKATISWMDNVPLHSNKTYLLQHGVNRQKAKVTHINNSLNVQNFELDGQATALQLNQIGEVEIKTAAPIFADTFADNPGNGAFILIDEQSNHTVGVGFIL